MALNITITRTEVQVNDSEFIAFQGNSLVDSINAVTDKDEDWQYNLDIFMPNVSMVQTPLYNSIVMTRNGQNLTVDLTRQMLPVDGRYICQFRGTSKSGAVYRTEKFNIWVKDSVDLNNGYNPMPAEFYQYEEMIKAQVEKIMGLNIPVPTKDDAGKSLTVDENGNYVLR